MVAIMKATVRSLFVAAFAVALIVPPLPLSADKGGKDGEGGSDVNNCYSVTGQARYGALGYNHVVIISNRCEFPLKCKVWTDVDPEPQIPLTVEPKSSGEKTTRINSPARGFKAFGECKK